MYPSNYIPYQRQTRNLSQIIDRKLISCKNMHQSLNFIQTDLNKHC